MASPREWDASTYDQVAAPMTTRGIELLDRLPLSGDETVIDAGCGTGQVTGDLRRRLPGGHVIALDGSAAMLALAREQLGDERVTFVQADLERPLPVDGPVDAVISTSTFHWIADHGALFAHLADVLRPGGALLFECGGHGNIATVVRALHALGYPGTWPWTYATPAETERRLAAAGFEAIEAELVPRAAPIPAGDLERYLETVVLGSHIAALNGDEEAIRALVRGVAERLPEPSIDYVRLNVTARLRG